MYGGIIWLVNEKDPRKEYILLRRLAVYDPTLPIADELLKEEKYKVLTMGEPREGVVLFPPKGEVITVPINGSLTPEQIVAQATQTMTPVGGN